MSQETFSENNSEKLWSRIKSLIICSVLYEYSCIYTGENSTLSKSDIVEISISVAPHVHFSPATRHERRHVCVCVTRGHFHRAVATSPISHLAALIPIASRHGRSSYTRIADRTFTYSSARNSICSRGRNDTDYSVESAIGTMRSRARARTCVHPRIRARVYVSIFARCNPNGRTICRGVPS